MSDWYIAHSATHKYIKKEWRNGHWVYYYNKPKSGQSLRDKREALDEATGRKPVTGKSFLKGISSLSNTGQLTGKIVENLQEKPKLLNSNKSKEKEIEQKEAQIKDLEKKLEMANEKGFAFEVVEHGSSGATELNRIPKAEIESQLDKLRAEVAEDKKKLVAKHSDDYGTGYVIVPKDSDLIHHGRLGQKWGERNGPPYPLEMTNKQYNKVQRAVQKVAKIGDAIQEYSDNKKLKREQKAADKAYKKEEAKRKDAEKEKAKTKEAKDRAVRHNSYQELYEIKDKLSYQELQEAFNRIDLERRIYAKANPPKKSLIDSFDRIMDVVGKMTKWTNKGMDAYDALADIVNHSEAVNSGKVKPWRKYKSGNKKSGGDKKKDDD